MSFIAAANLAAERGIIAPGGRQSQREKVQLGFSHRLLNGSKENIMKVTQVAIRPTEASDAAHRPALTPELLAASGARYSRSNEGVEAILSKIDPQNLDKSVDSIFRMIDYGHQSIADMVPVAMFIDSISIWLAYYVWSLCPTAGGQESSTRYIKLSSEGLIAPAELGLPEHSHEEWWEVMESCFDAYQTSLKLWEDIAGEDNSVARIPAHLLEDSSDKAKKQVARMKRNYGFDRARYFLPVAAATNMMLIMSARGWVQLCQNLMSHMLPEAKRLGAAIREELALSAPRMLRHAEAKDYTTKGIKREFENLSRKSQDEPTVYLEEAAKSFEHPPKPFFDAMLSSAGDSNFASDLQQHENRYAWIGESLKRTAVRFGWEAVALAELRDLNRHRTGNKCAPMMPLGFYSALDQVPAAFANKHQELQELSGIGRAVSASSRNFLSDREPTYIYWTVLGTQYAFEHLTTADKFIYEAELRTGTGAHYRYAKHLHDVLQLWYSRFPQTRELILEGGAEPE